jgi:Tfp pilus assembly protein PilF
LWEETPACGISYCIQNSVSAIDTPRNLQHSRHMHQALRFCTVIFCLCALFLFFPKTGAGKDTWVEVRSPNFTVISNAGEKEARNIADQFEQFRELFHTTFPKLRVDLGKPLIIFAVKNEDSLKLLLPGYWEAKGHSHPAGVYAPGEDRHFVAVRTDAETENPYQIVYHEYTHAIMDLNFRGLPTWLGEGLAEFYANSAIHDKNVEVGKISPYHLQVLHTERLIPIEVLLEADAQSPYYNEQNHASMFYAESWAIVHYMLMDPEARKRQVLTLFLQAWDATGNQVEAAQKTFGDLKKFSAAMELYSRQRTFYVGIVKTQIHGDPKSYTIRALPPAELDAERSLFYTHTHRPKEAMAAVEEALREDPNLPLAHEARGLLAYSQGEFIVAEEAFDRAIALNSTSYVSYYLAAEAQMRQGLNSGAEAPQLIAWLEKAIQMNPQFAPAYAALSSLYSVNPATRDKAFVAGRKAIELEPGNLSFATGYGFVLVNAGKTADAKALAERIRNAAKTSAERENVQQLLEAIANGESYDRQVAAIAQQPKASHTMTAVVTPKTVDNPGMKSVAGSPAAPKENGSATSANGNQHEGEEYAVEGTVASVDCGSGPGKIVLTVGKTSMKFRYSDLAQLQVVPAAKQEPDAPPACSAWNHRHVRLYFYKVRDKEVMGDLDTIQFFQ